MKKIDLLRCNKYDVDAIPHVLCGGFTKEETEYVLVDCHYLGLDNIMALRGDAMKHEPYFKPTVGGNNFASELVKQIKELNDGKYLHNIIETTNKSDFCVGVAGYPEKHLEAPSMDSDLRRLKEKVVAGADYVVTQMFFDNQAYFDFVAKCRKNGINIPIIPGLKPLTTKRQLSSLPQNFHVNMPDELVRMVEDAKSKEAVKEAGIAWCIKQAKELKDAKVPVLHFYTMGKSNPTAEIARAVF